MDAISETYKLIDKYSIHARKRFGQNFLTDPHVLDKIIDAAGVSKEDFVLEIGPGLGTMTRVLAECAGRVLAVEIDYDLVDILEREIVPLYDNLEIIEGDILKQDVRAIADEYNNGRPIKVVANLPYYITTPIIMELLEKCSGLSSSNCESVKAENTHSDDIVNSSRIIESITVMVQKEVADRMLAALGDKNCGAITYAINYYSKPYLAANVPPNCFKPRPKVHSSVIRLDILSESPVKTSDETLMFKLIRAAFSQRRKTLLNAISNSAELDFSKSEVSTALTEAGLDPAVRGEKLTLLDYSTLSEIMSSHPSSGF